MKMPNLHLSHLHLPHVPTPRKEAVWLTTLVTLIAAALLAVAVGVAMNPEYLASYTAETYPPLIP